MFECSVCVCLCFPGFSHLFICYLLFRWFLFIFIKHRKHHFTAANYPHRARPSSGHNGLCCNHLSEQFLFLSIPLLSLSFHLLMLPVSNKIGLPILRLYTLYFPEFFFSPPKLSITTVY